MDACPICGRADGQHGYLAHAVHDEIHADGYAACRCDPDEHDGVGPCVRQAEHLGVCVGYALDEGGQPAERIVQYSCRDDDSEPHQLAA